MAPRSPPPPLPDMATLPEGLVWNEFQKYFRGHSNQLVAQHWRLYQQEGGKGDGSAMVPEKARPRKKSPTNPGSKPAAAHQPTASGAAATAATATAAAAAAAANAIPASKKVELTPSPTGRSGRVRKANSLYVGGSYAVDTKASALRVADDKEATVTPLPELLPYATMLDKLAQRRDARAFAKPMDELWNVEHLEGYYDIIKKPMDMRTVVEKLRRGEYNEGGVDAFAADVGTIWQNCMTYTPDPSSLFYKQAQKMSELFQSEFDQLRREAREEQEAKERQAKQREAEEREAAAKKSRKRPAPLGDETSGSSPSDAAPKKRSHKKKVKVEGGASAGGAAAAAAAEDDFAALVQPRQAPKSMHQFKQEIIQLLPQLKKRKLRHALDIVRKADQSLSSAMDSVAEDEEFSLDLDTLSDETIFALHVYCEKHVVSTKDKLKVSLVVASPTERTNGNGGGSTRQRASGNEKPAKPKRSHKKKVPPPAVTTTGGSCGRSEVLVGSPPVKPRDAHEANVLRSEAQKAAAAALEREEFVEPLFADEHEPSGMVEDLFGGGPLAGITDVPISAEMFSGTGP